jgi:GTP-binding protein
MFAHQVHLIIQAGNGGNGCESFQPRTDRKRVPYGGDGGKGGNVIFRADLNAPAIGNFKFKQHLLAENAGHGGTNRKSGKNGKDLLILVPIGTRLRDRERDLLIRDLVEDQEEVVVAQGGRGGVGNLGGKDRTLGEPGEKFDIELAYRVRPEVTFVGLPNAGKSTLMNLLTRTHLKAENYPFCTRNPEVGTYMLSDYEQMLFCELPSIYQGSEEGHGLGQKFLVHLEFSKFIFFVIDPVSPFADSLQAGYELLKEQIGSFDAAFKKIPHAVIVTKSDLADQKDIEAFIEQNKETTVFSISSETGEGIEELKEFLLQRYEAKTNA